MSIKIVTDSTSDLSPQLAGELGITVVPAYVHFGNDVYRDRVEINEDELYQRLLRDPVHPTTEPPRPQDFADVYSKLSQEADGIVSIHISAKLSATCNSALRGKELLGTDFPIEVIDSQSVTMGLGLLVLAAQNIAGSEKNLPELVGKIKRIIPSVHLLGILDTLKYLAKGGRISKAKAFLGSMMAMKPILAMKQGELEPARQFRKRAEGVERLIDFVRNTGDVQDLAIVYSTTPDEAQSLAEQMGSLFNKKQIRIAQLGPVLGVHGGPGILFVAARV